MIHKRCWFSQIDFFIEYFPHRIKILFITSQFDAIHRHIQEQPFFTVYEQVFPIGNLFQPYLKRTFSNYLSHKNPVKDDRKKSFQEEQLDLQYWTMILAICVVVDESKCLDTPILEFSTMCEHLAFHLMVSLNSLSSGSTFSRWSFSSDHFCFSFSLACFPIDFQSSGHR